MKNLKLKRFLAIFIAILMISTVFSSVLNNVNATNIVLTKDATKYKFNTIDLLRYGTVTGSGTAEYPFILQKITREMLDSNEAVALKGEKTGSDYEIGGLFDNELSSDDASFIYVAKIGRDEKVGKDGDGFGIIEQLAKTLNVSKNDIELHYIINLPKDNETLTYIFKNGVGPSEATINQYKEKQIEYNKKVFLSKEYIEENEYGSLVHGGDIETWEQQKAKDHYTNDYEYNEYVFRYQFYTNDFTVFSAKAYISDGREYSLVIGDGEGKDSKGNVENYRYNWYMVRTKDADKPEEPTPEDPKAEFKTTLEYKSNPEGKMSGDTYLPPYYDNDNSKKDVDATAIIKSKTEEEIVATNGVKLTDDGKPNSEGWYYPDVKDKTVIAKDYPFDDYDNTTANGKVKETVKLTGAEGGEDSQSPSIQWTFRRKTVEEKENPDGSVTVEITYNLPVDPDSIPDDWSPVYDEDGKTIHKIQKTIKKGEDYDKDVTVKQNGTDAKVTTHVKKIWEKLPEIHPVTGETSFMIIVGIIIISGVAVVSYLKFRK